MSVLLEERDGHVLRLVLNRPEAHNAISPEVACRLADAFTAFEADEALRVCVLTGAGEKSFCSGGDLGLMLPLMTSARQPETEWDRRVLEDPEVMDRSSLRRFRMEKPLIAAVNGHCLAGGLETLLATDIRLAAPHATFGLPEARRGLIPFAGALTRLPRQVPQAVAMEMLMTGGTLDAERAREMGLVNRVVPAERLMEETMKMAHRIAANGPLALREIKRTVLEATGRPLDEGYALEDAAKDRVMASEDAREGPRAFMEKRDPVYSGR
ncbi:crotonase/enoyl-CoA hydratase family protein [Aquicoccus sp. SCR17]|nr:crotonase/enoyl-CoA hydratase family protein [Carideicomes alvinocaridis]